MPGLLTVARVATTAAEPLFKAAKKGAEKLTKSSVPTRPSAGGPIAGLGNFNPEESGTRGRATITAKARDLPSRIPVPSRPIPRLSSFQPNADGLSTFLRGSSFRDKTQDMTDGAFSTERDAAMLPGGGSALANGATAAGQSLVGKILNGAATVDPYAEMAGVYAQQQKFSNLEQAQNLVDQQNTFAASKMKTQNTAVNTLANMAVDEASTIEKIMEKQ